MRHTRFAVLPLACALACAGATAAPAQVPGPTLQSVRIVGASALDVAAPPAAVTLEIKATSTVGLSSVAFRLRAPSGHQFIGGRLALPYGTTTTDSLVQSVFGGGGLRTHGLNVYSEPGTWTLDSVTVCDTFLTCAVTAGTALTAVTTSASTITVANNGQPVTALPRLTAASIATPTLSITQPFSGIFQVAPFQVSVTATDGAPGIVAVEATFQPPSTPPFPFNFCVGSLHPLVKLRAPAAGVPAQGGTFTLTGPGLSCGDQSSLAGTYTMTALYVADQAGNVLALTGARLAAAFGGAPNITVTK